MNNGMRKLINPSTAPSAIGTYNQGIETEGLVFTSGQIGLDPNTGEISLRFVTFIVISCVVILIPSFADMVELNIFLVS